MSTTFHGGGLRLELDPRRGEKTKRKQSRLSDREQDWDTGESDAELGKWQEAEEQQQQMASSGKRPKLQPIRSVNSYATLASEGEGSSAAADSSAAAAKLWIGQRVRLVGLGARPELNGVCGVATEYIEASGRLSVSLSGDDRRAPLAIRPMNLEPAERIAGHRHPWGHSNKSGQQRTQWGFALADDWQPRVDVLRGYVSMEKFDGIRALWVGSAFRSRSGITITPPPSIARWLPAAVRLDGELWMGRGQFEAVGSAVLRKGGGGATAASPPSDEAWAGVTYVVFDAPSVGGGFLHRIGQARELLRWAPAEKVRVVETRVVADDDEEGVRRELFRVEALGGEGIMLRRAESLFRCGRSCDLLKVKSWQDAEALVLGWKDTKNSLVCEALGRAEEAGEAAKEKEVVEEEEDGRLATHIARREVAKGFRFAVSWNRQSARPPPGTVITFKHAALTREGCPRFPSILRVHRASCDCDACSCAARRRRADTD
jgi:DNA ligase-1